MWFSPIFERFVVQSFWGDKHIEKQAVTITKQHQVEEKNNWEINFSNIFEPIK